MSSKKIWKFVSAVALCSTLVAAIPVLAASITSVSNTISNQEAGLVANHVLFFTTPSGIPEGNNITLSFSSEFNTASITENDIDITDDGTDLTTATDCSGTEEASIIIASDVVTITICAGDGGAIIAASAVTIEIGTNATASGTGSNQIVNPATVGTFFVTVGGTFGDTGNLAIPVISDGSVSVTGTVPGDDDGGGGGGGGGGCTDFTDPIISDLSVSNITATSAIINWTTNEAASSTINYGLTASYEIGPVTNSSLLVSHSLTLTSLTSGNTYHYSVSSADYCGNSTDSLDATFATIDSVAPIISNIEVVEITATSARVTWITNEATVGRLDYGKTATYGLVSLLNTPATSFSTTLTGLSEGTAYHFKITATDSSDNSTVSSDQTFTTLIDVAPSNVSRFTATAGDSQIELSWINPTDSDLDGILIIFCVDNYPTSRSDLNCTQIYNGSGTSLIHRELTNDTVYYYGAFAYDFGGHYASGALTSATPISEEPIEEPVDVCGDLICGSTESSDSCLVDCPISPIEPPTDTCGDGICGESESSFTCFIDCGVSEPTDVCGDGTCDSTESSDSCPTDCSTTPTATDICGNGICESTETVDNCSADCLTTTGDVCGDGTCQASESSLTCSADCGETTTGETVCGNAICEENETTETCSSDCPSFEIPPTTVGEGEKIPVSDVSFFGAGTVKLKTDNNGMVDFLTSSKVSIIVSPTNIVKEVTSIYLVLGSETYLLSSTNGAYQADVTTPGTSTRHALSVIITYSDSTVQTLSFIANLIGSGLVYEKNEEQITPTNGVNVTLFVSENGNWKVWDGSPWNQFNPVTTNDNGIFAWYVENGNYKITIEKAGYEKIDSGTFAVSNNIINPRIEIKKIEEIPITNIVTTVTQTIENTVKKTVDSLKETLNDVANITQTVRESPTTQTVATVAVPVIATAVITSTIILATAFDLLPFLQLLLTSPLLLFNRRKRQAFGVIYHAFTKTPIDLATVRLYQLPENKLVMSRVTDKGGRYFFMVKPGSYRIEVSKFGFVFPSQVMKDVKDDVIYLDVYHGERVEVSDNNTIITPNIPLEPMGTLQTKTPFQIRKKQIFHFLQKELALTGIIFATFVFLVRFSVWTALLLGLQIIIYLLIRRLATTPKPKSWGIVYDKTTGRPLSKVIVRLFEPKYHKLLETWITDDKGRYAFILGPNQYSSTFEKTGYQTAEIQPIDLTKNKEVTDWAQDLKLEPKINSVSNSTETK